MQKTDRQMNRLNLGKVLILGGYLISGQCMNAGILLISKNIDFSDRRVGWIIVFVRRVVVLPTFATFKTEVKSDENR